MDPDLLSVKKPLMLPINAIQVPTEVNLLCQKMDDVVQFWHLEKHTELQY